MNHVLDTQSYFVAAARGQDVSPPSPNPPGLVGDDRAIDFGAARDDTLSTFSQDGVIDTTGPALGIAFCDLLVYLLRLGQGHRTGLNDARRPPDAADDMINGRLTDEQRKGAFNPELPVPSDASAQQRLLAYTGRDPST
jgi:hypothetical protein